MNSMFVDDPVKTKLPLSILPIHQSCIYSNSFKMTNVLSLDFKSSALLIALVLVPIVILFCAVAVILACSEHWPCRITRPYWLARCCRCLDRRGRKKRLRSDIESGGNRDTESSETPLEYEVPVSTVEHV